MFEKQMLQITGRRLLILLDKIINNNFNRHES